MKKWSMMLAFVAAGLFAQAQSTVFKPFKFDLALGYAIPAGDGAKGGVIFAMEPKYAINDNITLGLRAEVAAMARAFVGSDGMLRSAEVKASGSYLLTGDYYFNTNRFRPFVGAGAGIYRLAAATVDESNADEEPEVASSSKFGFMPRAGFEFGHFRTALEYNFIGKTAGASNNYFGIKMGFFIGGGRMEE